MRYATRVVLASLSVLTPQRGGLRLFGKVCVRWKHVASGTFSQLLAARSLPPILEHLQKPDMRSMEFSEAVKLCASENNFTFGRKG